MYYFFIVMHTLWGKKYHFLKCIIKDNNQYILKSFVILFPLYKDANIYFEMYYFQFWIQARIQDFNWGGALRIQSREKRAKSYQRPIPNRQMGESPEVQLGR